MEKVSKKYLFFVFVFFFIPLFCQAQQTGPDLNTLNQLKQWKDGCERELLFFGPGTACQPGYDCEKLCSNDYVKHANPNDQLLKDYYQYCYDTICYPNKGKCWTATFCLNYVYSTTQPAPPAPTPSEPPTFAQTWCAKANRASNVFAAIAAWFECIFSYLLTLPFRVVLAIYLIGINFAGFISGLYALFARIFLYQNSSLLLDLAASKVDPILGIVNQVRHFVIPLIFIALALVGLATILRIREYEAQKTFFPLLIVSILIFFSTPIVQGIVTLANIPAKALLGASYSGAWKEFVKTLDITGANLKSSIELLWEDGDFVDCLFLRCTWWSPPKGPFIVDITFAIANSFLEIVFHIILLFLLFWYIAVFVVRIAFIWLLLILAPIAFFTAAFRSSPELKAILPGPLNWGGWWEYLLQWAFIPVFLAFFLFVADHVIDATITVAGNFQTPNLGGFGSYASNSTVHDVLNQGPLPSTPFLYFLAFLGGMGILFWGVKETPGMAAKFAGKVFDFGAQIASLGALAVGVAAGVGTTALLGVGIKGAAAGIERLSRWEAKRGGFGKFIGAAGRGFLGTFRRGFEMARPGVQTLTEAARVRLGERAPKEVPFYKQVMEVREEREKKMKEEIAKDPTVFLRERNYYYTDPDTHKKLRGGEALESYLRHASAEDLAKIKADNLNNPTLIQNIINNVPPEVFVQAVPQMSHSQITQLVQGFNNFAAQGVGYPHFLQFLNAIRGIPPVKSRTYRTHANQYPGLPI